MHAEGARLASIQRLRGIAALLVVLVHAIDLADRSPDAGALAPLWLINDLGASGVDLFFVLSGFVMTLGLDRFTGPGGWRRFLVARAIRILPLFWLLNLLLIVLIGTIPDWRSAITALLLLPAADMRDFYFPPLWVGWTLAFEAGFYLMVALAARSARPAVALVALVGAASLAGAVLQPSWPLAQVLLNPIMLEFGLGVLICLAWRRGVSASIRSACIITGALLLVVPRLLMAEVVFSPEAGLVIDGTLSFHRVLFWGVPWALILTGATGGADRSHRGGLLHKLGDASYSLYLSHAILVALIENSLAGSGAYQAIVTVTTASMALGLATHRWVEQPLARLLRRTGDASAPTMVDGSRRVGQA
ncbi:acyltransferase [Sphingomonas sp.]|jgi:peptidoglycan/LPS O-acetylase OafA/YrhL|uniref:acyltransferase family protein n=1 Tax=Sphingomonas sp. TaxID=28214 RepID=UPI002DE3DC73|nr:acyltransferase [Sphingomonas sp.]